MTAAKSTRPSDRTPASYEDALGELERIVQAMESGQLSLDDTLAAYKRGNLLLQFCRNKLQAVEQQVQVLDGEALRPLQTAPRREEDRD
jgi:exodeoxyribonuclease VII small subunit